MTEEYYATEGAVMIVGNCGICGEARNRHMITGKLVNVETWHKVWTGAAMRPSLADTPIENVIHPLRPLIARPVIPAPREGDEPPQYRVGVTSRDTRIDVPDRL